MTISTSDYGTNSTLMTIGAGETQAALLSAIESYITSHGWSVHDASAGTNAKAYSAVNIDASTYKYVVIDVNTSGYIIMKLYEDWNATTHAGTNLATNSDNTAYAQRVDLTNGSTLFIGSNSKWLIMLSYSGGAYGSSTGNGCTWVAEMTRDAESDTVAAGYPKAVWSNPQWFFGAITPILYTRTLNNYTGTVANSRNWCTHICGGWGYAWTGTQIQAQVSLPSYPWTISSKKWLFTVRGFSTHTTNTVSTVPAFNGRMCGIKTGTRFACAFEDTTTIKCDTNFFEDITGTSTDFIYMNPFSTDFYVAVPK